MINAEAVYQAARSGATAQEIVARFGLPLHEAEEIVATTKNADCPAEGSSEPGTDQLKALAEAMDEVVAAQADPDRDGAP